MFSPIKNLITYIQKNASGTSLFGGSAAEAEVIQKTPESETESTQDSEKTDCKEVKELYEENLNSREESQILSEMEVSDVNHKVAVVEEIIPNIPLVNFDEDDIEMQIKCNKVLRKSFDNTTTTNTTIFIDHDDEIFTDDDSSSSLVVNKSATKNHDHNQNHEIIDVELEDFRHEPVPVVIEDFCSVGSESAVEEESEEARFFDLTHELDNTFPSEVIVINEPDLNSSINSDVFSEDPLAIEDIAAEQESTKICSDNIHLETHHTDSPGDILWINIDDIKSCAIQKVSCESTTTTSAQENPIVEAATTSTASCSKDLSETLPEPNTSVNEEEHATEELRGDGSDSGLGSETSTLQTTLTSATDTSLSSSTTPTPAKILRSNLKRRLETTEDDSFDTTEAAESSAVSNAAAIAGENTNQKKPKRSINFENVQVYYFPRQQGFGCVPSAGGCTLGMGARHISFKTLTLTEHAAELRRAHRQQLQDVNPRGSSSEESEESEEDYLSEGSGSDLDAESSGFLQPVSPKQRRALLKAAGVRKIDASEKAECRDIRNSREVCGCTCRDFCDPETCACSQAGIKCQVDRAMFPCGCSRDACGNTVGRVEFNPSRVRTHFIHTIMRLEMESRHQQKPTTNINFASSSSINALNHMSNNYYSMQTQSNYSSGYASPAYPNEQTLNYYQQQNQLYSRNGSDVLAQTHHQQYQVDSCLESSLFCGTATGSPSYGELMPAYSSVSAASGTIPTSYHAPLSYPTVQHGISATVSPFSTSNYLPSSSDINSNNSTTLNISGYSSCAVPSAPPFGTATTTAASTHYHSNCSPTLETTTAASNILDINSSSTVGSSSSFISLNSPISSSTRLSAINDLLQHNRNTTAALVAVSNISTNSSNLLCSTTATTLSESSSIDTPPIEYTSHKSCLTFEEIPAPLNPTPIVAVLEEEQQESKSKNVIFDSNTNVSPTNPKQSELSTASVDTVVAAAAAAPVEQSIVEVSIT